MTQPPCSPPQPASASPSNLASSPPASSPSASPRPTPALSLPTHPPPPPGPFSDLSLTSPAALLSCTRVQCPGPCRKSRRYFCSSCILPLPAPPHTFPRLRLPLFFHILQAAAEHPQRSTAQHIPLLAPGYAKVWRPFPQCAEPFRHEVLDAAERGTVALLFPSADALLPSEAAEKLPRLRSVVVLDASWTKSTVLMEHAVFSALPRVTLPPGGRTRFWRYAPTRGEASRYFSPDKVGALMSTVEAVHAFCEGFRGDKGGKDDDLLWLFAFLHGRVREVYEGAPGKRRRIMRKSKGLLHQF